MGKMTMFVFIAWILTAGAAMGWPQDNPWTFDPAHISVICWTESFGMATPRA